MQVGVFHSLLGLRPDVMHWADRLRAAGFVGVHSVQSWCSMNERPQTLWRQCWCRLPRAPVLAGAGFYRAFAEVKQERRRVGPSASACPVRLPSVGFFCTCVNMEVTWPALYE
jgi:hypothetical protein